MSLTANLLRVFSLGQAAYLLKTVSIILYTDDPFPQIPACSSESPEGLVETVCWVLPLELCLRLDMKICISITFPGDMILLIQGLHFENCWWRQLESLQLLYYSSLLT